MRFKVESMICGGCARSVAAAIRGVDPTAEVSADAGARLVDVRTVVAAREIACALANAGYPAVAIREQARIPEGVR